MSSFVRDLYIKAHMKVTTFYWLLLVLLGVVEFTLIRKAVLTTHGRPARVMYVMVGVIILAAWRLFERHRREHEILYIFMLGMLALATWVRF